MKQKLIIIGAGSVGKFIAYNLNDFNMDFDIIGFLDDDTSKHNTFIAGFSVLGSVSQLESFSGKGYALVWGIAFPKMKNQLFEKYKNLSFDYPNFISKNTWISNEVKLGKGCIVYPGVSINYETNIEDFVVINMNCAIGHNCTINSFTSLAPGVNLGGNTIIEENVEMGIGSSTVQGIRIGNGAKIGGQAMVINNIKDFTTVVGIPAK